MLRETREHAGFTQEKVAQAAGLTRTSLTNIEKGRQKVLLDTFVEIAHFLKKPAGDLLHEAEAKLGAHSAAGIVLNAAEIKYSGEGGLPEKAHAQIDNMIARVRGIPNAISSTPIHKTKSRRNSR